MLAAHQAARVEQHAARCDACRRLLAALGRSPSLEAEAPTVPLGSDAYMALARGEKVGRFMVLGRIGAGGMGVVFAAYDPKLDRKVALKLLRSPEDGTSTAVAAQKRLLREAQAMAQLSHPNVIAVYDVGTYEREVYIAMEFVEGETLTGWLRRWDRSWRDILDKFLAAGSALAEAHGGGLAHRDFKPDNVLVGHDERVRVMDFGLARSLLFEAPAPGDGADGSRGPGLSGPGTSMLEHPLTRTGALLGTPRYMAPEQLAGHETDARSDQFSFCVALYEALYKQHPFADETAQSLVKDPAGTHPRPPPQGTQVPDWLHQALVRGLSADAKDRFPSMDALMRALSPPPPRPARGRLAAALAVAALGVMTSAYAVPALIDALETNDQVTGELREARQRIDTLQKQINSLIAHIQKIEDRTRTEREAVRELEQRLRNAQQELERAEQDLSMLAGGPLTAGQRAALRGGPRPARDGLDEKAVLAPARLISYDMRMCFGEWLERKPGDRVLFAVRLEIGPDGVPGHSRQLGGIHDGVLPDCVIGNLEKLRFPTSNATSVVHYEFYRGRLGTLDVSAKVVDVRRPTSPG